MIKLYFFSLFILTILSSTCTFHSSENNTPQIFYVDVEKGNDRNSGDIKKPFQTIDMALKVVQERVEKGIRSDKIYLRAGIYKKNSSVSLYRLDLKGTPDDYSVLSAMPCEPATPGSVKHKSGQWYEKVVIDDAWVVETPWTQKDNNSNIWVTDPGYTHLEWIHQNLWNWTRHDFSISDNDDTPETTTFTVAPYLLLQDSEPSIWVNSIEDIKAPGQHFYDHSGKLLFIWPKENKNPNQCKIETWYGGPEDYEIGTLHLDGEGRGIFVGNLEYAAIRGFEFRMFNKIFEFHRRKYNDESERVIQRDVLFEDNVCNYGWIHILLDGNTVIESIPGVVRPKYEDRARWTVRNNVFYRPSREVCQLHGDDHVFESNVVIDHLGPWAGPAVCVSAVNTRNTRNAVIRGNYFIGQGNNPWNNGSVFMIETSSIHADENGDYIFGGQTYENNIIANVSSGAAFVLGKGNARLQNITIRNNIIANGATTPAILMGSPHKNLTITGNLFYNQQKVIEVTSFGQNKISFDNMKSDIVIRQNMFVNNKILFHKKIFNPPLQGEIDISDNLYWGNGEPPAGKNIVELDPRFYNPEQLDFRIGNVDLKSFENSGMKSWEEFTKEYPRELVVGEFLTLSGFRTLTGLKIPTLNIK